MILVKKRSPTNKGQAKAEQERMKAVKANVVEES